MTKATITLSSIEFDDLMQKSAASGNVPLVHARRLRQCADEIARAGHAGWGNTCLVVAEAIEEAAKSRRSAQSEET